MKTALYLLNINDYAPEVTELTYPLIRHYARKIGAEIVEIRERRYPAWPVTYEKLQIHRLAQENGAEWHIYMDSDTLIHPETPDWTNFLPRDTVMHNGYDMANIRWRYDEYFLRDGRNIGSCNWNTTASRWCLDLWRPIDDLTPAEVMDNIYPTVDELNCGAMIRRDHLVDDYALSRNIARFGLKVQTIMALEKSLGFKDSGFYWHAYTIPIHDYDARDEEGKIVRKEGKVSQMKAILKRWQVRVDLL